MPLDDLLGCVETSSALTMPFILFILWLVFEILLSARIAEQIGGGFLLLWMLSSIAGGLIVIRMSGWKALQRIQAAMSRNELPARDMLNGLLLMLAGVLLILPGPISDAAGLILLLPFVRAPALRAADAAVRRTRPDLQEPVTIEGEFVEVRARHRINRDEF